MPEQITETAGTILEATSDAASGRMRVLCISAGKGSSGVYPRETLVEAANNRLVSQGTFAFLDHPSATQDMDRPERSVRDLAGVFTSDAQWSDEHNGLVAEMQVFSPYRQLVAEMAPHIGMSIRGDGEIEMREGQKTVTSLAHIHSVDFVTRAGRGGRVLEVMESARPSFDAADMAATAGVLNDATQIVPVDPAAGTTTTQESQEDTMPQIEEARLGQLEEAAGRVLTLEAERDAAVQRATAAEAERDRMRTAITARPLVAARLAEAAEPLPPLAQARVADAVLAAGVPTLDTGAVNTEALHAAVEAAATTERAYLAALAPAATGAVYGAFGSHQAGERTSGSPLAEAEDITKYETESARIFGRATTGV